MPLGLDTVDLKIIDCLAQNGRLPFVDIASIAEVSEATVRNRVQRLTASGILTFVGVVDPFKTGLYSVALIAIEVKDLNLHIVCEKLSKYPEVRFVVACAGTFNIMVEVVAYSTEAMTTFVSESIVTMPEIVKMSVSQELKLYKNAFKLFRGLDE